MRRSQPGKAYTGDSLDAYFYDISQIPLMPQEQEIALSREYHNSRTSQTRREEIIGEFARSNLRFAVSIAKRYRGMASLDDLIAVANDGLIEAAEKFDYRKNVKFISYAVHWVKQRIFQHLAENSREARVPLSVMPKLNKVRRFRAEFMESGMSENEALDAALKKANLDARVHLGIEGLADPVRLNHPSYDGDKGTLGERLAYAQESADGSAEKDDSYDQIEAALETIPPREAAILRLYYGLDDGEEMTLEKIGTMYGITRERIRQLRDRALERLRTGAKSRALQELCS